MTVVVRLACVQCNGAWSTSPSDSAWDLCPSAVRNEPCVPAWQEFEEEEK